jgi:dynactin complex subunit
MRLYLWQLLWQWEGGRQLLNKDTLSILMQEIRKPVYQYVMLSSLYTSYESHHRRTINSLTQYAFAICPSNLLLKTEKEEKKTELSAN